MKDLSYEATNYILLANSILALVVFTIYLVIVLRRTKCRIYYRMAFIFVAYFLCFFIRLLIDCNRTFVTDPKVESVIYRWLRVINSFATRSKWIFLYYFVIIVRDIKIRISIDDPRELGQRLKKHRRINNSILAIFIACQIFILVLHVILYLFI
jgi:hypothetical protein